MVETATGLVGRAAELELVERALAETESGDAVVLAVSGEPGIGKTSLLAELGRRAEKRNWLVLSGRASELERDLPYWIFVDALDEYLRSHDPGPLDRLHEQSRAELRRIFPSLAGSESAPATVLHERYRVHRAVSDLLEQLAELTPLVLLLDDLHWADPASVDLITALLRRPAQGRILIGLAFRSTHAPARLAAALGHGEPAGQLTRIELGSLGEAEAGELLGPGVPRPLARALFEASGGNPFYLEQLARAAASTPSLRSGAPVAALVEIDAVPPAVAAALGEELAALTPPARALLEGGSVIGDPFDLELAAAAADIGGDDALVALDELLQAGLIRRTEAPRRFRFRHPLLRRVVYHATASGWRNGAHERAARALAAHGAPAAVRARHVEQFAPLGDRAAVGLLREAADSAAQRAPASAARWYRAALRLLPADHSAADERVLLLDRLAGVLAGTGEFAESHAVHLELLDWVPPEQIASRIRFVAACASVEHLLGRHEQAHARLVAALEELPDRTSAEAAALLLELALDAFYARDYEQMYAWAGKALALAEELADAPLLGAATASLSLACALSDRVEEGQELRERAATIVDVLTDEELALRLDAAANLGNAETYLDRLEDAVRHLDRGLAVSRATGQGQLFPLLTQRKGFALTLLGRLAEARDVTEHAVEAARLSGSAQSVAWALLNRAWAALIAGDLETALAAAQESVELGRQLDDSPVSTWSACALGSILLEAGEPSQCLETLVPAAGGPDLPLVPGVLRSMFLERVALAWLAAGEPGEAQLAVARGDARAADLGLDFGFAMARRARAAVALAAGDAHAAAEAALEAASAAEAIDARVAAARSRVLAGRALAVAGERQRGATELERAAAELDACGAVRYRDEAERELRKLGRRHHRRRGAQRGDGESLAALTRREREVAELVRERKTNREIAAALFLSEKTVETHLRHIFGKLGVSSRASVARALEAAQHDPGAP
jgi:ATP/maltotriose-dependent transcriptional regulator MalT